MSKRIVDLKSLGDGSGRALIHYFVEGNGPIAFPGHAGFRAAAKLPEIVTGRIACNPQQNSVKPVIRDGVTFVCLNTSELRGVTCPNCLGTTEAKAQQVILDKIETGIDEKGRIAMAEAHAAHDLAMANQGGA